MAVLATVQLAWWTRDGDWKRASLPHSTSCTRERKNSWFSGSSRLPDVNQPCLVEYTRVHVAKYGRNGPNWLPWRRAPLGVSFLHASTGLRWRSRGCNNHQGKDVVVWYNVARSGNLYRQIVSALGIPKYWMPLLALQC